MTDKGAPGSADTIGVTLWDGSRLVFSSQWTGAQTVQGLLGGGNLARGPTSPALGNAERPLAPRGACHAVARRAKAGLRRRMIQRRRTSSAGSRRFDAFQTCFDCGRPHQALGTKVPRASSTRRHRGGTVGCPRSTRRSLPRLDGHVSGMGPVTHVTGMDRADKK